MTVNDVQNVQISFRGDLIDDDIRQADHDKFASIFHEPLSPDQGIGFEHQYGLANTRDNIVSSPRTMLADIGVNVLEIA